MQHYTRLPEYTLACYRRLKAVVLAPALLLAITTFGCGDPESTGRDSLPTPAVAPPPGLTAESTGSRDVVITLSEYRVSPTDTLFQAGVEYGFVAENIGHETHMWQILNESGDSVLVTTDDSELHSGGRATRRFVFPAPGRYSFVCGIDGHRARGMETGVRVQ
jgi:plastocyanin